MKKALVSLSIAFLLVACGDTVENVYQSGMEAYASEDDLPKCSKDNENDVAFVKEDLSTRVCMDGEWVTSKDTVYLDGGNYSCKTEELKDKSGLKIVCNGDSIGVVLNGSDGKQGENGEPGEKGEDGNPGPGCSITDRSDTAVVIACGDSTITIDLKALQSKDSAKVDSEQVSITLDSLVGYAQKGPFLKGSTVYLYELSDEQSLKPVYGPLTTMVLRDDGYFRFPARSFASPYALIVVEGNYRNEVTRTVSDSPIRLKALVDLSNRDSVNVNVLTHLEYERVHHLVTREKYTVEKAKQKAQQEILKMFHIELDSVTSAEDQNIFGSTDADAALLAISILLQGDRTESGMMVLLSEISTDVAGDGLWNSEGANKKKTKMADWSMIVDAENKLAIFSNTVMNWGLGAVPDFAKFVRNFWYKEYGISTCTNEREGEVVAIRNEKDVYYNSQMWFICKSRKWEIADIITVDTYGWIEGSDGDLKKGDSTDVFYKYDEALDQWVFATINDTTLKLMGCTTNRMGEIGKSPTNDTDYVCKKSEWQKAQEIDYETYGNKCTVDSLGKVVSGVLTSSNKYYCAASGWISLMDGWDWNFPKEARLNPNIEYDTIIDSRDKKVYKIVTIAPEGSGYSKIWMAENLNYANNSRTPSLNGRNWCYDGAKQNCEVGGRLYTWAAAIDSVILATDVENPQECGDGKTCTLPAKVQGICPTGWHLPSKSEWEGLFTAVGGQTNARLILKSKTGWNGNGNGTDDFGFSALPVGYIGEGYFNLEGFFAGFWSSTEDDGDFAYMMHLYAGGEMAYLAGNYKNNAFSVRCLKDED